MKLIIQIPCLNEAKTLEIALNDLPKHIDGIDEIEYLIVDDGKDYVYLFSLCEKILTRLNRLFPRRFDWIPINPGGDKREADGFAADFDSQI